MKREIVLGTKPEDNGIRDAVHVPVISAIAHTSLARGIYIGIIEKEGKIISDFENPIGIVDPFYPTPIVTIYDEFWICLYPQTITSLRHVWEHPVLKTITTCNTIDGDTIDKSKLWITNFASLMNKSYDDLVSAAEMYLNGNYVYDNTERYKDFNFKDFWRHYKVIYGGDVPDYYEAPFTCSC